ncbi:ABC transporter substrate-binding protein [Moorellaceae bacterium AZ2]
MKRAWIGGLLIVALVATLCLGGCGKSGTESGKQETGKILVGTTSRLTGSRAVYGIPECNGARIAAEEINAAGGVEVNGKKYKIELVELDDQNDPTLAFQNVKKLVEVERCQFLIGFGSAPLIMPAMSYIEEKKIPTVVGAAPDEIITATPNPYVFRMRPPTAYTGMASGQFIYNEFGVKTLAVMGCISEVALYKDIVDQTIKGFEAMGGKVTSIQDYKSSQQDMTPQITAALATKPDTLYIVSPIETQAFVFKQVRELGYKGKIFGFSGGNVEQYTRIIPVEQLNGIFDLIPAEINPTDTSINGPAADAFVASYRKTYGGDPPPVSGYLYDTVKVLAEAIKTAGTFEPDAVVKALENLSIPDGLALKWIPVDGKLFDQNHQAYIPNAAFVFQNGQKVVYKLMDSPIAEYSKRLAELRAKNSNK